MRLSFKQSASLLAISFAAGTFSLGATAQEAAEQTVAQEGQKTLDTIVVTGIRRSLTDAADIKRAADGVVDAISAEDIGKFPDANLAESLQRITGVSIDRQNNEGNQISVRGLGPSFNLVMLNNRQMPAASSPETETINSSTQSRAFNFAEIASESVSGVEVYKTAKANLATGGIGATVNVKTARPFDYSGTKILASVKGIHDTSVEEGDAVTPEIGGLFSTTFADGRLGVLINGSFSERHSREVSDHNDGWSREDAGTSRYQGVCDNAAGLNENNDCSGVPFIYRPITNISEVSDSERQRLNGQLVFQAEPVEGLVATLDYTLSRFEVNEKRYQTGLFGETNDGRAITNARVNPDTGTLASYSLAVGAADALAYNNELQVDTDSIGFNVEWDVSDSLSMYFDIHSSAAESQPNGELNDVLALVQGPLNTGFDLTYSPNGFSVVVDDSAVSRGVDQFGNGAPRPNVTEFMDPDGLSPLGTFARNVAIKNDVDQIQLGADWEFDNVKLSVGGSNTKYTTETFSVSSNFQFQGLGDCTGCDGVFTPIASGANGFDTVLAYDATLVTTQLFPTSLANILDPDTAPIPSIEQSEIEEDSTAIFANATFDTEVAGMPAKVSAGLRWESTNVTGTNIQSLPIAITVTSPTEASVIETATTQDFTIEGSYDVFLPAVDFQLSPTDNMVVRASYGKSLARPDLNALKPALIISDVRPNGPFGAVQGNPDLEPYLSDNFDLAFEWYYKEGSYAAINYFHKSIQNYIGTQVTNQAILNANGVALTDPSGRFDFATVGAPATVSAAGDPVIQFEVTSPFNSGSAKIDGLEFAIQHLFGETGFGVQANYTLVESNAEYDPQATTQSVNLVGLSDSANLVGFYENDTFQVRLAGNWRDEFLFSTNQLRVTNEPVFIDAFLQWDLSASYTINENFEIFGEVLNITGEDQLQRGRFADQFLFGNDQKPRLSFGARASF